MIEAHKANLSLHGRVQLTAGNINAETVVRSFAVILEVTFSLDMIHGCGRHFPCTSL